MNNKYWIARSTPIGGRSKPSPSNSLSDKHASADVALHAAIKAIESGGSDEVHIFECVKIVKRAAPPVEVVDPVVAPPDLSPPSPSDDSDEDQY